MADAAVALCPICKREIRPDSKNMYEQPARIGNSCLACFIVVLELQKWMVRIREDEHHTGPWAEDLLETTLDKMEGR